MRKRSIQQQVKQSCTSLGRLLSPRLFKALGDPQRIAILLRLLEGCTPRGVTDIAQCCPINISVVSRHLALLRDAGLVEAQKVGKQVFYAVRVQELVSLLRQMADCLEACCGEEPNKDVASCCTCSTKTIPEK